MGWRIRLDVGEKKDPLLEGSFREIALDPHTPVSSAYRRGGGSGCQKRRGERRIVGGVEIGIGAARGTVPGEGCTCTGRGVDIIQVARGKNEVNRCNIRTRSSLQK